MLPRKQQTRCRTYISCKRGLPCETYKPCRGSDLEVKVVIHNAENGGYWAEVPAVPGCVTQGETFEELLENLYEAVEGCLSVPVEPSHKTGSERVMEIEILTSVSGKD